MLSLYCLALLHVLQHYAKSLSGSDRSIACTHARLFCSSEFALLCVQSKAQGTCQCWSSIPPYPRADAGAVLMPARTPLAGCGARCGGFWSDWNHTPSLRARIIHASASVWTGRLLNRSRHSTQGPLRPTCPARWRMTVGRGADALTGGLLQHMSGSGRALAVLLC